MKKLINDPADVVTEALRGVELAHPQLRVDHENKVVFRGDAPVQGKVGLVSGGGSGHEPLQGGFVGPGGLDAACAGEVFTSPVPDQMLAATKGVDGGAGVLHIVKNYTGDIMNFEMAAELAAAEDVQVETVVINDDVAVAGQPLHRRAPRRRRHLLLEKIAGAAAEEGRDLAAVAEVARKVNGNARSMGMALTSCTVPAAGKPTFDLPDDEMEVGIGIHGEPGRRRVPLAPAREIAEMLVEPILGDLDFTGGDGVLAFVNGMGGTPLLELYLMYGEVARDPGEGRGARSPARWSATTSPAWTWPAARSPCSRSTTSCCGCGTRRSTPPACGGGSERGGRAVERRPALGPLAPGVRRHDRDATTRTSSPSSTRRSATPTTAPTCDRGMTAAVGQARRRTRTRARPRCSRRSGMTLVEHGRRGQRAAVRHVLPADGRTSAATEPSSTPQAFAAALRAGLDGVVARGKAEPGDKTMVDALDPGRRRAGRRAGRRRSRCATRCGAAARPRTQGRDATIPLVGPQGPGQLPGRAQRRAPGPRRHLDRAAARTRPRRRWAGS